MTTENMNATAAVSTSLQNSEILTGHVVKPYIKGDKLLGAVLSFDGRSETALLHIRQMSGEKPAERLAELGVGDPLLVRIMIQQEGSGRPAVWATEKGVEHSFLVDMFAADKEKFANLEGTVHGITDFGIFIEIGGDGPARGHRGLLRSNSMSSNGRVKLGSFVTYKPGDFVSCDMAEIRVDDSSKLLIRLENARPRSRAAA
jgi:ribosomal protein S1